MIDVCMSVCLCGCCQTFFKSLLLQSILKWLHPAIRHVAKCAMPSITYCVILHCWLPQVFVIDCSVSVSVCLCLSVCLSVSVCVCLFVCLSVCLCLSVWMSVCLCLSLSVSVCLSVWYVSAWLARRRLILMRLGVFLGTMVYLCGTFWFLVLRKTDILGLLANFQLQWILWVFHCWIRIVGRDKFGATVPSSAYWYTVPYCFKLTHQMALPSDRQTRERQ